MQDPARRHYAFLGVRVRVAAKSSFAQRIFKKCIKCHTCLRVCAGEMMRIQRLIVPGLFVSLLLVVAPGAAAQSFTADARAVGMGGDGKNVNIAASMVEPVIDYGVIPIPLGLIQVLGNLDAFNPSSDGFDPAWAIEAGSNPLHYTFGRKSGSSDDPQQRFIRDLLNGELSRDLTTYSGFSLPATVSGEGLASPAFGPTIKFAERESGAFHGLFIGAGPYISYETTAGFDERLIDIFETGTRYPNSSLRVDNGSAVQLAMSIVFGYRGRLELPSGSGGRDGIYLAANYRYLKGFKYFQPDATVRFDTDAAALLTVNPATTPFTVVDLEASNGSGRAVDLGIQVVQGPWEFGGGVNGIGNQIEWSDLTLKRYTLNSLISGAEFTELEGPAPLASLTVELPVVTTGNVGYDAGDYAFRASVTRGFNGTSFHGGAERQFAALAVRGGMRFSRDHWDPTYGVGFGRRVAIDVGFYSTHNNLQDKRQTSMAISIRIQRED